MSEKVKVTVVGSGYVGMSLAVLLAQHNDVTVLDIDPDRVDQVNRRESTVADPDIEVFLKEKELSLSATLIVDEAYSGAEFVVVATPTNYDPDTNRFDTRAVDTVVMQATCIGQGRSWWSLSRRSPWATPKDFKGYTGTNNCLFA